MIIKSYEVKKNKEFFYKNKFLLFYVENFGLIKVIKEFILNKIKKKKKTIMK